MDLAAQVLRDANRSEAFERLPRLVERAVTGHAAACNELAQLARDVAARFPDPRGRPLSAASATHQLFLRYFELSGRPQADVWDDLAGADHSGDFVDEATSTTRRAFKAPSFDSSPAHRRLNAYRSRGHRWPPKAPSNEILA
jgi:hypothetical protein